MAFQAAFPTAVSSTTKFDVDYNLLGLKNLLEGVVEWRVRSLTVRFSSFSPSAAGVVALLASPYDWDGLSSVPSIQASGGIMRSAASSFVAPTLGAQGDWRYSAGSGAAVHVALMGTTGAVGLLTVTGFIETRGIKA